MTDSKKNLLFLAPEPSREARQCLDTLMVEYGVKWQETFLSWQPQRQREPAREVALKAICASDGESIYINNSIPNRPPFTWEVAHLFAHILQWSSNLSGNAASSWKLALLDLSIASDDELSEAIAYEQAAHLLTFTVISKITTDAWFAANFLALKRAACSDLQAIFSELPLRSNHLGHLSTMLAQLRRCRASDLPSLPDKNAVNVKRRDRIGVPVLRITDWRGVVASKKLSAQ